MDKDFLNKYLTDFSELIIPDDLVLNQLVEIKEALVSAHSKGNKGLIFGNGGSAAIASHFSVDLTKNASVRCLNFNESDLITCFSNDYGFENWIAKAVEFYGDQGDVLIVISSSGKSKNMINATTAARAKKFSKIVTLSGFEENNPLRISGDINLWVNSKAYNFVENLHQIWLLALVDLVIGDREYSA
ncbi:MAG: phosphoheptose isomerase [Gammaproteobacteria bacterium]|nr:phosphoheptose isomerase [Gammaproteobacteria bacterium]|tara:strand:- start:687 stop:1250 length:564 start_codon:yes stop_codon:yes gene_type:complete